MNKFSKYFLAKDILSLYNIVGKNLYKLSSNIVQGEFIDWISGKNIAKIKTLRMGKL